MRIFYLVNQRIPTEKAYGLQIVKTSEALASIGHSVTIVAPLRKNPSGKTLQEFYSVQDNFKAVYLRSPDFYFPGQFDKLAVIIKGFISAVRLSLYAVRHDVDIIYSRDEIPLFLLSFFKSSLVFEAHRFSENRKLYYRRFLNSDMKILTTTEGLRQRFLSFGFLESRVAVAHDGIDLNQFKSVNKLSARNSLSLPSANKIIGYVGQLTTLGKEKGVSILLDAFQVLQSNYPDVLLLIVGGSERDIAIYQERVRQIGISSVLFVGNQPHKLIPIYLSASDIVVMPYPDTEHYRVFMSPLKLFEYMACGRPIVASDLQSLREVLNDENATLVKPDDTVALAHGIGGILKDPSRGEKQAERALQEVQKYTWEARVQRITHFIT